MDSIGTALIDIRRENLGSGLGADDARPARGVLDRIAAHDAEGARAAMAAHLEGVAAGGVSTSAQRPTAPRVTLLRRLDHVAVLVRETDEALASTRAASGCGSTRARRSTCRTCG